MIDARGGLICPGFEDAHLHFRLGALSLLQADLQPARSIQDIAAILRRWGEAHPGDEWIVGRGWHYGAFPSGMPDRRVLDRLVPDRPAVLESFDAHNRWLNTLALRRAAITARTPDPAHGTIERDPATGEPTGILKEFAANDLLDGVLPAPTEEKIESVIGEAIGLAQRCGLTAVQEAWTELEDLRRYARLRQKRSIELGLRLRAGLPADAADWAAGMPAGRRAWESRLAEYSQVLAVSEADDELSGGIVKAFADGVIESRTAWMLEPYEDAEAAPDASIGRPNWTAEALAEMTRMAVERGWQVEIHAIGDAAIRAALDAHAAARLARRGRPASAARDGGRRRGPDRAEDAGGRAQDPRGRIEHVEWPHPDDVPRFGRLGVIASMQPFHASPIPDKVSVRERQIGARTERGWPWASILRAGGVVAFGSDWPVATFDPIVHLRAAVTRTHPEGRPGGGWLPRERLGIAQAIACYTWGSAYAAFAEDRRGTIALGRNADLVILDRDLLAEVPSAIGGTHVRVTIQAGRVVYRAD